MKPTKLKRHLETKHPQLKNKDESYFKRLATKLKSQQVDFQKHPTVNQKALQASFEVSFLIDKTKKPHNIGEMLILPAAENGFDHARRKVCQFTENNSTIK
ncbi:unnamed protein product [Parnassius mnemosyne]|uniref:Zinc finger BED domain-containing protein 5 n=1 Tax=Parnassius mnemosyne TaxID=213953 RepID=A0AAV1KZ23_9NEOP